MVMLLSLIELGNGIQTTTQRSLLKYFGNTVQILRHQFVVLLLLVFHWNFPVVKLVTFVSACILMVGWPLVGLLVEV